MKKILFFTSFFATLLLYAQTLTNTENYVYTRTYLEAVTTPNSTAKQIQEVQYFDGLGRVKQNIAIKTTPTEKDLVVPVIYDENGKISKNYLPLPAASLNGTYHSGIAENSVNSYYGVTNAYSQIDYEKSPVSKILKASSSGDDWKINGNHTKTINYFPNGAMEVMRYKAISTWNASTKIKDVALGIAPDDSYTANGYYKANTLYKYVQKDEDGLITHTFTDSSGKTILKRKLKSSTDSFVDTYYVYDESGNLVYIIPPKAAQIQNLSLLNSLLNSLCYQYRYDKYNRLAESKLPGKDYWESVVYDKQGRVVLTQDSNQRHNGEWSYVKYDRFDRPVYNGIYGNSSTRAALQTLFDNSSYASSNESFTTSSFNSDGKNIYYTKTAIPASNISVLSVNYYDTYPPGSPSKPSAIQGANTMNDSPVSISVNGYSSVRSTKALPTATYVKNIEDNHWSDSFVWYDQQNRSVGTHTINHLGGYTKTESKLDFSGFPLETYVFHKRLNSDAETLIKQRFVYDDQKRLKIHYHQVNNNPEEILAQNEYDDLSRLKQKKVGGISLNSPLQVIDYEYNIHGWLTGINKSEFSNPTNKLFAYDIRYNNPKGSSEARYNGNISEVNWMTSNNGIYKRYNYKYDHLDRITLAEYSHPDESIPQNDFYNEEISYDLNGNIERLKRHAPNMGIYQAEVVDDLEYMIDDGNRITKIEDYSGNPTGYEGGGYELSYDANGNMISMPDKNINDISYNFLNLPSAFNIDNNLKKIFYTYRADGTKIRKIFAGSENNSVVTDYIDGFQYLTYVGSQTNDWNALEFAYEQEAFVSIAFEGGMEALYNQAQLTFIPTAEGFYDFQNNKYIYQYRDHLGNSRLSYFKIPNGGLDIVDQNDYYPFGMNHIRPEEVSYFGQGSYANYKYNSKELQETGMYDYGWRQYMPDIGRWNGIDQLASSYSSHSPYAYVMNNPVMSIDPDGRYTSPIQDLKDSMPNIYSGWEYVDGVNFGDWNRFQSGAQFNAFVAYMAANGGGGGGGSGGGSGGGFGSGGYSPLIFNDGLKEVLVPEVTVKGKSSGWGSQMWNHFTNFMAQWNSTQADMISNAWNGNFPRSATVDAIIKNDHYNLVSLGLDQAVAKSGSYLTKALQTKSTVNFTVLNKYTKPAFRTKVAGSMLSTSKVANVAKGLKVAGNVLAGAGLAVSAYQYSSGQISGLEFGFDTAVTIIGFMGPVGAGFSLVYFGAKAISEYNGYQWFDRP